MTITYTNRRFLSLEAYMQGLRITSGLFGIMALLLAVGVSAQPYPSKAIRLISPYPPGGGTDASARIVAQALSDLLGQQVVVDSRGGASGRIGTELAAKAPPDGYTLVLGNVAPM